MSINEKIAQLLENNRDIFEEKPIAFDGVVDEASFEKSQIKTVFLLKEVNWPDMKEDWRDFMENTKAQASADSMYKTWPNICLWMEALKNEEVTFADCVDGQGYFKTKDLQGNLLEVGIVNIKKTAGGSSSDPKEINEAAEKGAHIIIDEMKFISPQLVICGGTFEYAQKICGVRQKETFTFPSGAQYFIHNGMMYLKFVHPMWFSVNRNILFAYAKVVFEEVRSYLKKERK